MEMMLTFRGVEGEPRVGDENLGAFLGMAKPTDIRRTIKAHIEEFEAFGNMRATRANYGKGQPGSAWELNRSQCVLACILGDTPKAKEMRVP